MQKLVSEIKINVFWPECFEASRGKIVVADDHPLCLDRGDDGVIHRNFEDIYVPRFEDPGADWGCAQPHPGRENVPVRLKPGHFIYNSLLDHRVIKQGAWIFNKGTEWTLNDETFRCKWEPEVLTGFYTKTTKSALIRIYEVLIKIEDNFKEPRIYSDCPLTMEVLMDCVRENDAPGTKPSALKCVVPVRKEKQNVPMAHV